MSSWTTWVILLIASLSLSCTEKTPGEPPPGKITGTSAPASAAAAPSAAAGAPTSVAPAAAEPYRPPAVARALPAAHTVAVVGVEGLDWLFLNVARLQRELLPLLPAEALAGLPPQARDPQFLPTFFKLAPETPAAWQNVGLQPGAGLSVVLDDRLTFDGGPEPLLLAQITDRGRLLNFLNDLERRNGPGKGVTLTGERKEACDLLRLGETLACLGQRRGFHALMLLPADAESQAPRITAFSAFLADAGPALADAPRFKDSLHGYPGTPAAFAWYDHGAFARSFLNLAAAQAEGDPPALPPEAAFFLDRFPASALWFGRRGAGLRLLADPSGAAALQQILRPTDPPPDVSPLVGPQTLIGRFALNLPSLFDGVTALVPPSLGQAKGQILVAKNMIPVMSGVAWEDLTAGLTGHVTTLMEAPSEGIELQETDRLIIALGVKDPAAAQRALDAGLKRLLKEQPDLAGAPQTVAGKTLASVGPLGHVALIHGPHLLIGTPKGLEAALARRHPLPAEVKAALQGPDFLASAAPVAGILAFARAAGPELDAAGLAAAGALLGRLATGDYILGGLAADARGVHATSGSGMLLVTGMLAAIAVPAFVKYLARSKAAQARLTVNQLATAAFAYEAEHGRYPPSAPLTPARSACGPGNSDGSYLADPATFAHPTWQALGFAPQGTERFRYAFISDGKSFTARALGDLDCDGVESTFERVHGEDSIGDGLRVYRELE